MRHGHHIGEIPRAAMPQIPGAKQAAFLAALGVAVTMAMVPAAGLKKTQREIIPEKVAAMADAPAAVLAKPVIVSRDGYVLDGHHHWAHHAEKGEMVPVREVAMGIEELLEAGWAWTA